LKLKEKRLMCGEIEEEVIELDLNRGEMGGKIIASAVFLDFGIVDAIADKHRNYASSFVIPVKNKKKEKSDSPL